MLMHAVLSASTVAPQPASADGTVIWNLLLALSLWLTVALVAVQGRGTFRTV